MKEKKIESGLQPPNVTPVDYDENQPDEIQSAILVTLMRLYDVQMALLNETNPTVADIIFEKHEKGEDYNPTIYIPTMVRREQ
jgi:hypothetical protein